MGQSLHGGQVRLVGQGKHGGQGRQLGQGVREVRGGVGGDRWVGGDRGSEFLIGKFLVGKSSGHLGKLSKSICKKHMEFSICLLTPPPLRYGKLATFFPSLK